MFSRYFLRDALFRFSADASSSDAFLLFYLFSFELIFADDALHAAFYAFFITSLRFDIWRCYDMRLLSA